MEQSVVHRDQNGLLYKYLHLLVIILHMTVSVYFNETYFICDFRDNSKFVRNTICSDGSAAQHKKEMQFLPQQRGLVNTRSMTFVCHFPKQKSVCGVRETVKRLKAQASLQRPYVNQTMTPRQSSE
jgi:hypothetical protein